MVGTSLACVSSNVSLFANKQSQCLHLYVYFHACLFILELGAKFAENGLLGGESLTREFEQNGFVFIESCNVICNMLIYDPQLPNRAHLLFIAHKLAKP